MRKQHEGTIRGEGRAEEGAEGEADIDEGRATLLLFAML